MARTCLLKRIDNMYEPVVVYVKKTFIIELKGCGSPAGGFSGLHLEGNQKVF